MLSPGYWEKNQHRLEQDSQEIVETLSLLMQNDAGFAEWFKNASPKEREMALAINDAILGDYFRKAGKKKRLISGKSNEVEAKEEEVQIEMTNL